MKTTLAPWAESLETISTLADANDKLSLVFVTGPGDVAETGLRQVGDLLEDRREVLWHRLDESGTDLAGSLQDATSEQTVLLVHGLEALEQERRRNVERGLNLGRDALTDLRSVVVFWIPTEELDDFRRIAPDLFHWRSHLATAVHDEIEADLVTRWRYLKWISAHIQQIADPGDLNPEWRFWASEVSRGVMDDFTPAKRLAALLPWQAKTGWRDYDRPIPLWLTLANAGPPSSKCVSAALDIEYPNDLGKPPMSVAACRNWARRGDLLLMVDDITHAKPWYQWLMICRTANPRMRFLVGCSQSSVAPWGAGPYPSYDFKGDMWEVYGEDVIHQSKGLRDLADSLIRSLDPEFEPSGQARREVVANLRGSRDPRCVDALVRSLDPKFEEDKSVRSEAARALGMLEGGRLAKSLLRSLDPDFEPERENRIRAAISLGQLGEAKVADELFGFLHETDDPDLQEEIVAALVRVGSSRSAFLLRTLLDPRILHPEGTDHVRMLILEHYAHHSVARQK